MTSRFHLFRISLGGAVLIAAAAMPGNLPATDLNAESAYGIASRPKSKAYLAMPRNINGKLPGLLSQTGAYQETTTAAPATALIPYGLIAPFWSDHAIKTRWVSVPDNQRIKFAPTGEWSFPPGTVFVKTFTLATN